jgi:predicted DNA-binding protein
MIPIKDIKESNIDSCISGVVGCTEHPEKTIEIYCNDHSKPCCTVCATVHHRKCEHVVTIDKAVYGVKESSKAIELLTKLKDTSVKLSEILTTRKDNVSRFEDETNAVLAEISNVRESVNKHLDEIEDKLRNEMTSTKKTIGLKLNDDVTELSSLKSTVDNWKDLFEACMSQGSEIQCLVNLEELLEKVPRMDDDIFKLFSEMKYISVSFTPEDLVHNMASIGHIKTTETIPHSVIDKEEKKKVNFQTGKIKVLYTIDVGTAKSGSEQFLSGIFYNEDLIITDYANYRIVMYDDQGVQKKELKIDNRPTDITKVNDLTVAVATWTTKVYLVDPKLLTLSRIFTIDGSAWGISYVEDEYIVVFNGTISWIDPTTGRQIRELKSGFYDTRFASSSCKGDIIYMDSVSSVKCVSTKGNNFTYKSDRLSWPYSHDTDCDGNIYIIGYRSNNIHQLTFDGKCIRIIPVSDLTTITYPWVLRFKDDNNRFMLTFYNTGKVLMCEID